MLMEVKFTVYFVVYLPA